MTAATLAPAPAESKMSTEQTGLEKAATRTPAVITTPEQYRSALLKWQQDHYNILTPFTHISGLAASHGIITSLVTLSPNKDDGDVYDGLPFLKGDEVAPAKIGLRKLAECAGISTRTERTDGRQIPFFWESKAIGSYRGVDGSIVTREATEEWDLRDGSLRMKGWTRNQIEEGRKHGLRNCEARAINAAIRECGFGIKQKYSRDELKRPFVIIRVIFVPDMNDPDVKRLVTERALGGTTTLYPHAALPGIPVDERDPEPTGPRPVGASSTATSTPAGEPAKVGLDPDQPPTPDAVRIVKAEERVFTYKNGPNKGKDGTRYVIVDSAGVEHSTFDRVHFDDAKRFQTQNAWVEISEESDGQYKNLIEITKAGQQPGLPGMDSL